MFNRIPTVATYHCDVKSYPLLSLIYNFLIYRSLKKTSKVIVTSRSVLNTSNAIQKFKNKCIVIPLSISKNFSSSYNPSRVQNILEKYGEKIILFVGRLVKYKGLNFLIDAMKNTPGHLLIIGNGPLKSELQGQIQKNHLENKVTLCGEIADSDLSNFYKAARIVTLPSIDEREALGMCLIEALSFEKPLVTSRLSTGVAEVNIDGQTGFAVPVGDTEELSKTMQKLLHDQNLWLQFSKNSSIHFQKNFDLTKVTNDHVQLYRDLL